MLAAMVAAVAMFALLGYLTWQAKYGKGRTIAAVGVVDAVVLQQRVVGHGARGPVAQDRLVSVDGRTGKELARATVVRGELIGTHGDKAVYSIGNRLALYDARTLESSPCPDLSGVTRSTSFGQLASIGDGVILLETTPGSDRARVTRLTKEDGRRVWSAELPWRGHDTKLVVQYGGNIVIVDADGVAAVDRNHGSVSWSRP